MIRPRTDRPRRGMLAIAVLVCLIVLTLIAGASSASGPRSRDEIRAQERRLQAEWLAEAGLRRALARLDADPGYSGETWNIDARELDSADAATVTITVGAARRRREAPGRSAPGPTIPANRPDESATPGDDEAHHGLNEGRLSRGQVGRDRFAGRKEFQPRITRILTDKNNTE